MWKRHALVFLAMQILLAQAVVAEEIIPNWEAIPYEPVPLMPATPVQPVLSAEDVTDDSCWFVADPFLFRDGEMWHLFFEAYSQTIHRGRIAHAVSMDGTHWTYDCMVLTESYHLSYPFVFKVDGQYLMAICSPDSQVVKLYRAHDFPYDWQYEMDLLTGRAFADASIIRYDGLWWLFSGRSATGYCDLFYSVDLGSGWIEHPMSPITTNPAKGRPAGRFPVFDDGRILRFAQKNDLYYGQAVRAFEIDLLTTTQYQEHEIPESPILSASGVGWNRDGMHTCDPWWNGDHWIAAVDGVEEYWSIGIYRTATPAPVLEPAIAGVSRGFELLPCSPNPFRDSIDILYRMTNNEGPSPVSLRIYGVDGRLVWEHSTAEGGLGLHTMHWDGTDADGGTVRSGTYFYDLTCGDRHQSGRMIRTR